MYRDNKVIRSTDYDGNRTFIMPDFLRPPYVFLILGVLSISAATVFVCIGKMWVRFKGWVYRAKEPRWFWWEAALDYVIGVCFIGYFFHLVT